MSTKAVRCKKMCVVAALLVSLAGAQAALGEEDGPIEVLRSVASVPLSRSLSQPGALLDAEVVSGTMSVLELDVDAYEALQARTHAVVRLPTSGEETPLELELERFEVFEQGAAFVVARGSGVLGEPSEQVEQEPVGAPPVQLWRGKVRGDAGSLVFLGLSPLGTQGMVRSAGGTFSISTVGGAEGGEFAGRTMIVEVGELELARDAAGLVSEHFVCDGGMLGGGTVGVGVNTTGGGVVPLALPSGVCRVMRIAVDTDTEFTMNRFGGNTANALTYIAQLLGAVSTVYSADFQSALSVTFTRVWTTADPYSGATPSARLNEFKAYWTNNRPAQPHNTAHLLCGTTLGGGVAYLDVLCSSSFGFGVSGSITGSFPQPLANNRSANWDPIVVAHELGHNFGSGHTHEPEYYNPPVDGCGNAFNNPPGVQDCSVATARNGTIMSYCHLCPGGNANIDMTFGPRPSDVIRANLASMPSCGLTLAAPNVSANVTTVGSDCVGGDVTLSVFVVPQAGETLRYEWTRNGVVVGTSSVLALTNLQPAIAGSYVCSVSNGCQVVNRGPVVLRACPSDYNCSGEPTVQDIFDFLAGWFAGNIKADVNASGLLSVQDIFDFLARWFAGC